MRVIVIISIVHTSRNNSYLLAVILTLVSFVFSNHPSIAKSFILSGDILLNIFLFYILKRWFNVFISMALSIILSKLAYYLAKYLLIQFSVIDGGLISTPLYTQLVIIVVLSGYSYLAVKFRAKK